VQKQTGNIHAGWTQALIRRADGQFLHATTSSSPSAPDNEWANEVLYRSAPLDFDRYEAEDAAMRGAVATADAAASNGRKATLQGAGADLHFAVAGHGGARTLQLRYAAQGQADAPKVVINGVPQPAGKVHGEGGGWAIEELQVNLTPGADQIDVQGGAQPIAVDYLAFGHDDAARIRKTLPDTSP
jgi:hypothetical protein